jgi:hypothetical protein
VAPANLLLDRLKRITVTSGNVPARIPADVMPMTETEEVTGSNPVSPTTCLPLSNASFAAVSGHRVLFLLTTLGANDGTEPSRSVGKRPS